MPDGLMHTIREWKCFVLRHPVDESFVPDVMRTWGGPLTINLMRLHCPICDFTCTQSPPL